MWVVQLRGLTLLRLIHTSPPANCWAPSGSPFLLFPNNLLIALQHPLIALLQSQRLALGDYFAICEERREKEVRSPYDLGKCSSTLEGNTLKIAPNQGSINYNAQKASRSRARSFSL